MEENTLQPSAEEIKKPHDKKTKELKEKNTKTRKNISDLNEDKKSSKENKKLLAKSEKVKEPKALKKETGKKKIEKKESPKEKVSASKTKKTKQPKVLKKENVSSEKQKEETAPEKKYKSKSIEELIEIFKKLSTSEDWLKNHKLLISINDTFDKKFRLDVEKQKKIFLREGGNEIDFFFKPDYKKVLIKLLTSIEIREEIILKIKMQPKKLI